MKFESAIYEGKVLHKRTRPKYHSLKYKVFSLLLDLDELKLLDKKFFLFSYNRFGIISFWDKDHGQKNDTPLRAWVESRLKDSKITIEINRISLLCYPRIFGYVFNPISIYFCYDNNDDLFAILYEVSNTFHETHTYVLRVNKEEHFEVKQSCSKMLYVSPFVEMETDYYFKITPPKEDISIVIKQKDIEGIFLTALFQGKRKSLTNLGLLKCLMRYPFLTLKIISGIHWEALILWLKGIPFIPHEPSIPTIQSSNNLNNKPRF